MSKDGKMASKEVQPIGEADMEKYIGNSDVSIVDLRESDLYRDGHIQGAINISFAEFQSRMKELDPKKSVILVCHVGPMGEASGQLLLQNGFHMVSNLSGGMANWNGKLVR
ncbi:MAG: rhodanese-like domain-containing protein [Bacillota bacterium]|nr:rhodanese-like domain-containing protein [Bacillota bacterium]MDP4169312.1 rhodanese-like domain-containing protein [Bacillota bacterium]